MKIISRLDVDKQEYYVYVPLVGYSAYIPAEEYDESKLLTLMEKYSKNKYHIEKEVEIDRSKVNVLYQRNNKPDSATSYLELLAYHCDYPLTKFPYLTVCYSGKVWAHKEYPTRDSYNDTWDSQGKEPIGYLNSNVFTHEEDEEYERFYEEVFERRILVEGSIDR